MSDNKKEMTCIVQYKYKANDKYKYTLTAKHCYIFDDKPKRRYFEVGNSYKHTLFCITDEKIMFEIGYSWDGMTYVPNTPRTMRASLVHDALYQAISLRGLKRSARGWADREFRIILEKYEVGFVTRWSYWLGTRLFGWWHI